MSQRPKTSQSVALFPFLAVLVCTMGALIFLLLVTTRMIRNIAVAQAAAEKSPPAVKDATEPDISVRLPEPEPEPIPLPSLPVETEPSPSADPQVDEHALALAQREREQNELTLQWNQRVNKLTNQRMDRTRLLEQRQLQQRALTERIAVLKNEVKDMETKLGGVTGELAASVIDGGTKERLELEKQISELKLRLRAAMKSQNSVATFEVVPFDVNTGTSRRPILIECTETGLRFVPEDVVITPGDLAGFNPQLNPVVAGASALVNYWSAWNRRQPNPGKEPEPYVLLLVRPGGTVAYYIAMSMLKNLKQPHGYELIEADTVLQMPPVDAGAKAACEAAVRRLINDRNQVMRSTGSAGFGFGRGSSGEAFRADAVSGRGTGGGARGMAGGGTPFGGASGTGQDGTGGAGGGSDQLTGGRFEVADIMGNKNANRGDWDQVENFEGRPPQRGSGSQMAGGGGRFGSPGGSGDSAQNNASSSNGLQGLNVAGGSKGTIGLKPGTASPAGTTGDGSASSDQQAGNPSNAGQQAGNQYAGNQQAGASTKGGTASGEQGSPTSSGIETLDDSANDASGSSSSPGSNSSAANGSQPNIGLSGTNRSPIPVMDQRRKKQKSSDKPMPFDAQQLASHHWGLSEPGATIGLERDLRIDVEPTRFVIAGKHAVTVNDTDTRDSIFERMVTVMDLQARDWGKPPSGFFWKPRLTYVIAEGGDPNYEKIHSLLEQAGLASTRLSTDGQVIPAVSNTPQEKPAAKPQPATPAPAPKSRWFFWGVPR